MPLELLCFDPRDNQTRRVIRQVDARRFVLADGPSAGEEFCHAGRDQENLCDLALPEMDRVGRVRLRSVNTFNMGGGVSDHLYVRELREVEDCAGEFVCPGRTVQNLWGIAQQIFGGGNIWRTLGPMWGAWSASGSISFIGPPGGICSDASGNISGGGTLSPPYGFAASGSHSEFPVSPCTSQSSINVGAGCSFITGALTINGGCGVNIPSPNFPPFCCDHTLTLSSQPKVIDVSENAVGSHQIDLVEASAELDGGGTASVSVSTMPGPRWSNQTFGIGSLLNGVNLTINGMINNGSVPPAAFAAVNNRTKALTWNPNWPGIAAYDPTSGVAWAVHAPAYWESETTAGVRPWHLIRNLRVNVQYIGVDLPMSDSRVCTALMGLAPAGAVRIFTRTTHATWGETFTNQTPGLGGTGRFVAL